MYRFNLVKFVNEQTRTESKAQKGGNNRVVFYDFQVSKVVILSQV